MSLPIHTPKDRAIWVSLVVLLLAFGAYMLRETGGAGWMPACMFKKVSGFDCPGCGMTRGTHALLNGRVREAFLFNPVGMVIFPLLMIAVAIEVIGWVRGKPLPFRLNPGRWAAVFAVAVMIAWWVVRNVI